MAYSDKEKQSLVDKICEEVSKGKEVKKVLEASDEYPSRETFYNWIRNSSKFSDFYARACILRAEIEYEKLLKIADDGTNDLYIDEETGKEKVNHENIQRSRLRVDTRKWWLSKMVPKIYGDKIEIESIGDQDKPADALEGLSANTLLMIKELIEKDKGLK